MDGAVPHDGESCVLAWFACCHFVSQTARFFPHSSVCRRYDITLSETGALSWTVFDDLRDQRALNVLEPYAGCQLRGEVLNLHAQPSLADTQVWFGFLDLNRHDQTRLQNGRSSQILALRTCPRCWCRESRTH